MGHEFTSLVLALLHSGGHFKTDPVLTSRSGIPRASSTSRHISRCPVELSDVVQALNLMAVLNSNIRHTMIDGALFRTKWKVAMSWRCRVCSSPANRSVRAA